MSAGPGHSFFHLNDIIARNDQPPIFSTPDGITDDISTRLQNQSSKNGVVFDLRLGYQAFLSGNTKPTIMTEAYPFITIEPGQFALLTTLEILRMPKDLIAFISMKFGKSKGGLINISGFHVDPGFNGMLIFSVYNAGPRPLTLTYKEDVFMIIFSRITQELQVDPEKDFQNQFKLEAKHWEGLVGEQISPRVLANRIHKLETWNKVNWGLALALGGSIIAVFATFGQKMIDIVFGGG